MRALLLCSAVIEAFHRQLSVPNKLSVASFFRVRRQHSVHVSPIVSYEHVGFFANTLRGLSFGERGKARRG
jgi:hypothetical protein